MRSTHLIYDEWLWFDKYLSNRSLIYKSLVYKSLIYKSLIHKAFFNYTW